MLQDDLFGSPAPDTIEAIQNHAGVLVGNVVAREYAGSTGYDFVTLRYAYFLNVWHYSVSVHVHDEGHGHAPSPKWKKERDTFHDAEKAAREEALEKLGRFNTDRAQFLKDALQANQYKEKFTAGGQGDAL